ncbi:outer membrane transport energization protein ExbD [Anseongella ginsenosidimutans]|uniref:Outer membrane transport energization protein ExbD n=1 Tax=Anseongella ginsenosidimutans TaxID=496056 RepID=A0A4R3KUF6_9SPHI|nr:biopolymer transporter ExbD [Anseongella ginsenosidimutans]QEC51683.1 biopolymer transporter ExbD [Anseongella ginsenosidimutans]TCS89039.1 outer membrane transport energization protein ExbD [Anseongella ginsenosidimutans]
MAKVKPKRKSTWVDMTAMVDVAFLLLTFFILVSQFRPEEVVAVTTPSSTADSRVPEGNLIQITMDSKGRVFFGMAGQTNRVTMLENLGEARAIEFTEQEKEAFSLLENFGTPLKDLKSYLAAGKDARKQYNETVEGIPVDSANNELEYWIRAAKGVNRQAPIAIKGDRSAKYPVFDDVINTLKELNENKFKLVTAGESGGQVAVVE